MAAIIQGVLNFKNVYTKDLFDVTFDIEGIDLTGKTLKCQVRETPDSPLIVEFSEDDSSLIKTVVSATLSTVRLIRDSKYMDIEPRKYYHTIIMYSTDNDVQTIINGYFDIIPQITVKA